MDPGQTADVVLDDFDVNADDIGILEITYNFDKRKLLANETMKLRLKKKILDLTDTISTINTRLDQLEAKEANTDDNLLRYEEYTGSLLVVGSIWEVRTASTTGSVSYLYSSDFTPPVSPFNLASGTDQGNLAGSFTGSASAFGPFTTVASGGYDYS